jgi:hypothetical protein
MFFFKYELKYDPELIFKTVVLKIEFSRVEFLSKYLSLNVVHLTEEFHTFRVAPAQSIKLFFFENNSKDIILHSVLN